MDLMFTSVNHHIEAEQEGVAAGLGYVAASHFDVVLTKLEAMSKQKGDGSKKSSGLLSFIKVKCHNIILALPPIYATWSYY